MIRALDIAIGLATGAAGGAVSGMLGIGGGTIITPALALFLGIPQHVAQSISLGALLPPVGFPSLRVYLKNGVRIVWPCMWMLVLGFVVGSAVGGVLAHHVPERELRWSFALMLVGTAISVVARSRSEIAHPSATAATRDAGASEAKAPDAIDPKTTGASDATSASDKVNPSARRWTALPIGAIGGLFSGLFGIGGGVVIVPLLRKFGRFARLESQALTLAMMLPPIGLPALWVYADQQHGLRWAMVAAVATGFAIGSFGGAKLGVRVNAKTASRVFAVMLVASAVALVAHPRGP